MQPECLCGMNLYYKSLFIEITGRQIQHQYCTVLLSLIHSRIKWNHYRRHLCSEYENLLGWVEIGPKVVFAFSYAAVGRFSMLAATWPLQVRPLLNSTSRKLTDISETAVHNRTEDHRRRGRHETYNFLWYVNWSLSFYFIKIQIDQLSWNWTWP